MKIAVTGSRGLIGRALVESLRERSHAVVEIDLAGSPARDVRRPRDLADALAGCDGVIHLAALSRVAWGEAAPLLCKDINVTATQTLVDLLLARSQAWLVFASSREVYGNPQSDYVRESDEIAPLNVYGRSKAAAESAVTRARSAGLRTATLRFSNVYGTVNDHPDRAIPALLWRALQGEPIELTGGKNYFDFVHVDDCVDGLLRASTMAAAGERTETVHLATGIPTTLEDLAVAAVTITSSCSQVRIAPARAFDVSGFCGDPSGAERVLGWRASVDLATGMRRLSEDLRLRSAPIARVAMPS